MTDVSTTSYTLRVRSCAEVESIPSIPWFERLRTRKPCQYSINRPASGNKKTAHGKVKNASSSVAEPSTAQRAFPTFPRARLLRMRTLSFLILLTYKCGDLRRNVMASSVSLAWTSFLLKLVQKIFHLNHNFWSFEVQVVRFRGVLSQVV